MSKSLGNFITIQDFLKRHSYRHLRFLVLKNLWSSPMDYSESALIEVKSSLERVEEFIRKIHPVKSRGAIISPMAKLFNRARIDFYEQLADNFNTPKAFSVMFDFIKESNQFLEKNLISKKEAKEIYSFFEAVNKIFDIFDFKKINQTVPAAIKKLAEAREICRKNQDWQKSDELRMEIEKQGYSVEDTKFGPVIKKI